MNGIIDFFPVRQSRGQSHKRTSHSAGKQRTKAQHHPPVSKFISSSELAPRGRIKDEFITAASHAIEAEYTGKPTGRRWLGQVKQLSTTLLTLASNTINPDPKRMPKQQHQRLETILRDRLELVREAHPGMSFSTIRKMFRIATRAVRLSF